jgi:ABC-type oligopeptide transport system substrate-binding subunit
MRGSIGSGAEWLLTASFVAAACTPGATIAPTADADPDGEIRTEIGGTPVQIDPQISGAIGQIGHVVMVFEGLMTFDPKTLTPIPAAAKDFPRVSPDGLTYTFTLRDDLKYSDGTPLTARHFVYAFTRLCDPSVASPYAVSAYSIGGCEAWNRMDPKRASPTDLAVAKGRLGLKANGDKEFVVTLTAPTAYFNSFAAFSATYPAREADVEISNGRYGYEGTLATYVGNGPFKLVEWKPNEKLVFERNPYYRTPAKLKRWTKVVIPDGALAFAAYRNDEIDLYNLGVAQLGAVERDADLKSQVVDSGSSTTTYFVLNVARPPFTDIRVRQAFAKAIDREAYARDLMKIGRAAYSLIPPGHPGHDAGDRSQAFDVPMAKALLQSSSYAGKPELGQIRFVYRTDGNGRIAGEWLQQQLKRSLGVDITVEGVDRTTFVRMNERPDTAPHIRFGVWIEDYPDPHDWLTLLFHSSGFGASLQSYQSSKFDVLVRNADQEGDPRKRADLYQQASRLLNEDAPAIWLAWPSFAYLQKPRVRGVAVAANDVIPGSWRLHDIYVVRKN